MNLYENLPLLAMRGNIFFPHIKTKIEVARESSRNAVRFAFSNGGRLFMVSQIDSMLNAPSAATDFFDVGVVAVVTSVDETKGDTMTVGIKTLEAAKLSKLDAANGFIYCSAETLDRFIVSESGLKNLFGKACEYLESFSELNRNVNRDAVREISKQSGTDLDAFLDVVANEVVVRLPERQRILAETDVETRYELLCAYIIGELDMAKVEKRIANRVKQQVQDGQKEYYLREQMKAISAELGEDESELKEYAKKIEKSGMTAETAKKALKEINRLSKMSPTSPDAAVIRNYVDWLLDIPWKKQTKDNTDLKRARQILDEDHYGLEKIKERIIEFLAVMQLTKKLNGPILCFVGPPGVGKTSIVKSIARSLDRKYVRVSLGGVRDEAEIRGHRRTYVGAIPGKIIYMMKQAECINPVLLLDEIDKMSMDNRGDPASAMLEVLDPEQNNTFTDHFLEVPYDLSKVLFVCTANSTDDIPAPLLDRMEIIELSGYTELEKIAIAKKFLLKKNLELHGISEDKVDITDDAFINMIQGYTAESGVRNLEREIASVCRKAALQLIDNPEISITVTAENLHRFLGAEKYKKESLDKQNTVGSATGLAWTRVGGVTLNVDAALLDGKGEVQLTGNLGDVMKESARTAISLVKSLASEYDIDKSRFEKTDIHIHVPEGAMPKDGPSAGVTMATVVMSAFTGIPVSGKVAMTGEITLRGKVLPIGGLKEKTLAAYRLGIRKVIIPKDNESDLDEIPQEIKDEIQFIPCDNIRAVYENALVL